MDIFEKCLNFDLTRQAEAAGVYPYFIPISSRGGAVVKIGGREVIMLGSNNYLGLTQDERVVEAAHKAVEKYGTSCTGSRLMNGTFELHVEFEKRLAKFNHKDDSLIFTTGYQANLGTISALAGRHDTIVIDKADHASIVDGASMSHANLVRYKHNDMADLERVLAACNQKFGILLIVDGIFSMEGDVANLPEIVRLKKKYGARLIVDEAHSVGVFGATGIGTVEHFGVIDDADLIIGTFSKSFASTGGYVAGSHEVIHFIKHRARPFLFTAAIPPASAGAAMKSLEIIENEPERRTKLWENTRTMKGWLDERGFCTGGSESPIIPIIVGEQMKLASFWRRMFDYGVFSNAALPPAVEPDRALIRSSYMATHTMEHLTKAIEVIERAGKEVGVIH